MDTAPNFGLKTQWIGRQANIGLG
eukprot:COSAG01_NODE_65471_length_273_cov_0.597701_1_plen_23_part_10